MPLYSIFDERSKRYKGWLAKGTQDLDLTRFNQSTALHDNERKLLWAWIQNGRRLTKIRDQLPRIYAPLKLVRSRLPPDLKAPDHAWKQIFYKLLEKDCTVWGLENEDWSDLLLETLHPSRGGRPYLFVYAFTLRKYDYSPVLVRRVSASLSAELVFGYDLFRKVYDEIEETLVSLGYNIISLRQSLPTMISTLMLTTRSSDMNDYTEDVLWQFQQEGYGDSVKTLCGKVSRALSLLGYLPEPIRMRHYKRFKDRDTTGIAPEWVALAHRWRETSSIGETTRQSCHGFVLRIGLWLADKHPEIRLPSDWKAETAAEAVALVCNMNIGDYVLPSAPPIPPARLGEPMMMNTKCSNLMHLRRFFFDVEQWGWGKLNFNPHYHLAAPTRILRQRGPNPRVIDDRIWLKLVWASLNLTREDVLADSPHYPFELIHAAAVLWTHTGLRKNELRRLRLGCSTLQKQDLADKEGTIPAGTICYLTVPPSKTAREFVKPVAAIVHKVIKAWAAIRPSQPKLLDMKTGERVEFLLQNKGKPIGTTFIEDTIIKSLCAKAGVPTEDSRGKITSHRARASVVTALANSPDGFTLHELMKWTGHSCARSTMHYLTIRPTRLAATYAKADRMTHMVDVLIDHDAVINGDAVNGKPYKFYDLGDSYCTNPFWSTCPHRMACARCDFNLPKDSILARTLEARSSVLHMLEKVPLTDDERAAVEGDKEAIDGLIEKLKGLPTLDGVVVSRLKKWKVLNKMRNEFLQIKLSDFIPK
ncbi:tyrosine-type recombinase/integrase [Kiloniella sp. EL199]|uniref:tyrosine-type recombinase/integrase n=1 Tax=Kiloniella sp. EL199 TaxID=2107581 RepID=UPI000EA1497C|nr:tyrosine-type recombinase/integrase [Kiloniella sp. EL199]